ncbi:hypothetical protein NC652_012645 [Populus alba x Populus x berolinensis]|nr:hypothetical protein NC652_012645 [Populus alba x Populus x berolinensis]
MEPWRSKGKSPPPPPPPPLQLTLLLNPFLLFSPDNPKLYCHNLYSLRKNTTTTIIHHSPPPTTVIFLKGTK